LEEGKKRKKEARREKCRLEEGKKKLTIQSISSQFGQKEKGICTLNEW